MNRYRIIKDNFLGYEAQVRYKWLPFIWFQMNEFYWINTWPTPENAKFFIQQKKAGKYTGIETGIEINNSHPDSEFEKELKLLVFHSKNFLPEVVWKEENKEQLEPGQNTARRWWPQIKYY